MKDNDIVGKIINLGIGVGKVVEENAQSIMGEIKKQLDELIEKGEQADDEVSGKIKGFVKNASDKVNGIVQNSTESATEVFEQVKTISTNLVEDIKGTLEGDKKNKEKETTNKQTK